ncbi:MAG: cytochrome c [Steroidobacteraceae bacterium]|nr:cytochrome c [Steroidobacteraceae bacterium]
MTTRTGMLVLAGLAALASTAVSAADQSAQVERGRYLVTISGCNDCHTPGGRQVAAAIPEKDLLIGVPVGFQGPWGTSYASNLRLVINSMSESQWLAHARQERLPPMPWFNLKAMTDDDLKAVYAFVRSLGPAGVAAPAYVAPGGKVNTPYIVFVPQVDKQQAVTR